MREPPSVNTCPLPAPFSTPNPPDGPLRSFLLQMRNLTLREVKGLAFHQMASKRQTPKLGPQNPDS